MDGRKVKPTCRKCGEVHWAFAPCQVRSNQRLNVSFSHITPHLADGWRPWHHDQLDSVERRGAVTVTKGLRPSAHLGKVTYPREEET